MTLHAQTAPRPERITTDGHVMLSHNHICLLQGLYDHPRNRVPSRVAWIDAAHPYRERFNGGATEWRLRRAMKTINRQWILEERKGRSIQVTLTRRGKDIVERKVLSWIIGIGPYAGMPTMQKPPRESLEMVAPLCAEPVLPSVPADTISQDPIRRIIDFAGVFGLPLLESNEAIREKGTIIAVSTGLDRFFRLACREELDMHAPRRWHLMWVRSAIDVGLIPAGYQNAFEDYEEDDILCHLRELLQEKDGDLDRYVEVYRGKPFLSRALRDQWLDEIIDLSQTDMTPQCRADFVRSRSEPYRLAMQSVDERGLAWYHPDTKRLIGRAVKKSAGIWEMQELEVTTPAALSCLQKYWDDRGIGLNIETRYVPEEL